MCFYESAQEVLWFYTCSFQHCLIASVPTGVSIIPLGSVLGMKLLLTHGVCEEATDMTGMYHGRTSSLAG